MVLGGCSCFLHPAQAVTANGGGAHVSSQLLRTRQRKLRGWEGDCVVPKLRQGSGFFGQWSAQTVLPQGLIP